MSALAREVVVEPEDPVDGLAEVVAVAQGDRVVGGRDAAVAHVLEVRAVHDADVERVDHDRRRGAAAGASRPALPRQSCLGRHGVPLPCTVMVRSRPRPWQTGR